MCLNYILESSVKFVLCKISRNNSNTEMVIRQLSGIIQLCPVDRELDLLKRGEESSFIRTSAFRKTNRKPEQLCSAVRSTCASAHDSIVLTILRLNSKSSTCSCYLTRRMHRRISPFEQRSSSFKESFWRLIKSNDTRDLPLLHATSRNNRSPFAPRGEDATSKLG